MTVRPFRNPRTARRTIGVLALVAIVLAVYLATNAQKGLPWQPKYELTVEFPNAKRLVSADKVSIGGVQVGTVSEVTAVRPSAGRRAYAKVKLAIDRDVGRLPVDTRSRILSSSVLGATYVQLSPGASRETVPDGGTLPLANSSSSVQLTDLFDIFDRTTARNVQRTLGELGPGLAGRGTALNETLESTSAMLPPLTRVSRDLAAERTRLAGFLRGYRSFSSALAPVSEPLAELTRGGSRSFGALAEVRPALGAAIDRLPATEATVTDALTRLRPALDDVANFAVALRPGVRRLPRAVAGVNTALHAGVPPLRQLPAFGRRLTSTLRVIDRTARAKATDGTMRKLSELVDAAKPTIASLEPAQVHCNVIPVMFHNLAGVSRGYGIGREGPPIVPFSLTHLGANGELLQQSKPSPNVAINYQPNENADECEGGNEPYDGTQSFNNPPGDNGKSHVPTRPPADAYTRARAAGLLETPRGWRP